MLFKKELHINYTILFTKKKTQFSNFGIFFRIGDLDEEEDPNETQENGNPKKLVRRLTTINDAEANISELTITEGNHIGGKAEL